MKRLMLVAIIVACSHRFSASQTGGATQQVAVGRVVTKADDGKVVISPVTIRGEHISSISSKDTLQCHGMCEMATHGFLLRADDLQVNSDTGESNAAGHVRLSFVGAISQRGN